MCAVDSELEIRAATSRDMPALQAALVWAIDWREGTQGSGTPETAAVDHTAEDSDPAKDGDRGKDGDPAEDSDPGKDSDPAKRIAATGHAYLLEGWGRRGDVAFVATSDEESVGAAWFRQWSEDLHSYGFVDERTPEIGVGVDPDYRHRGIGTALLRRLIAEAGALGMPALSLSVEPDNPAADIYSALGFEVWNEEEGSQTMILRLAAGGHAGR